MAKYGIKTRTMTPVNFFAGDFPTVTDEGTAGEALEAHTPVTKNEDGKIVAVVAASGSGDDANPGTVDAVIGITAEPVENNEPVVYYLTGEFFAEAINLPKDVEIETLKDSLRKLSIFLR